MVRPVLISLPSIILSAARETELRQLRKSNMDHEERNAALQKHVESMRSAVQRLETELQQEQERNTLLQQHLQSVRQTLAHCLQAVPIPGTYSVCAANSHL